MAQKTKDLVRLSKLLSYLLRHGADEVGLALDDEGFAPLASVWAHIESRYPSQYTHEDLAKVVSGDSRGKKRFEWIDDRIRAMYGHNRGLDIEIQYEPHTPPMYLYHGTTHQALPKILREGLQPMQRQYVHLAIKHDLAYTVASRYTQTPVMLRILAQEAHDQGIAFFHPETSHFLCKFVPPQFLERDASPDTTPSSSSAPSSSQ